MKVHPFLLSLFFIAACILKVHGQGYPYKRVSIQDGLPGNSIREIHMDDDGRLWIGTDQGLARYDGREIRSYHKKDGLPDERIWGLAESSEGIWIGTFGSGLGYIPKERNASPREIDGCPVKQIRSLHYSERLNGLFIGGESGSVFFRDSTFYRLDTLPGFTHRKQIMEVKEHEGAVFIQQSRNGIFLLNAKEGAPPEEWSFNKVGEGISSYSLTLSSDSVYWGQGAGVKIGALSHALKGNMMEVKDHIKDGIYDAWDMALTKDGRLFIATWGVHEDEGGVIQYDGNKTKNISKASGISSTMFWDLEYDTDQEILWAGSLNSGLFGIDVSGRIRTYLPQHFGKNEMQVQGIEYREADSTLWFTHKGAITRFDPNDGSTKTWTEEDMKRAFMEEKERMKGGEFRRPMKYFKENPDKGIRFLGELKTDPDGNVWISTTAGLFCFLYDEDDRLVQRMIRAESLQFDQNGGLLVSIPYGDALYFSDPLESYERERYKKKERPLPVDVDDMVLFKGDIWTASRSLGLVKGTERPFKKMLPEGRFDDPFVKDLDVDGDTLWMVFNDGRVYPGTFKDGSFRVGKDQMPKWDVEGTNITFFKKNGSHIFIGTERGFFFLNKEDRYWIRKEEGWRPGEIAGASLTPKGDLWVGAENGVLKIAPQEFRMKEAPGKLKLQKLIVDGEREILDGRGRIELGPDHNTLSFTMNWTDPFHGDAQHFRYRIPDVSDGWSEFTADPTFTFYELPYRQMDLQVETVNRASGEEKKVSIPFEIQPPFYREPWFMGLVLVVVAGSVYGGFRYRVKKVREQEKERSEFERRIAETRHQALKAQMNPHFTFNAMNALQNQILDERSDEALEFLGDLSGLIRKTLDFSERETITLKEELDYLNQYLRIESIRFDDTVDTKIEIGEGIDPSKVHVPPMMVQPLVENAYKHAFSEEQEEKRIHISFERGNEDNLLVKVLDNGVHQGESNGSEHRSRGLALIRERLRLLPSKGGMEWIQEDGWKGVILTLSP